jgi:hypothetical protein
MVWNASNGTIFYTSELSLNTAYTASANAVILNSVFASSTAGYNVTVATFNAVGTINSEMYLSNVSTNSVILTASNSVAFLGGADTISLSNLTSNVISDSLIASEVTVSSTPTDTTPSQVWIG